MLLLHHMAISDELSAPALGRVPCRAVQHFSGCVSAQNAVSLPAAEFDAAGLVGRVGKGKSVDAIVEAVNSGSTLRVTLLPDLQSATVMVAGVQCPSMGRRPPPSAAPAAAAGGEEGGAPAAPAAPGSAAALVAAGTPQGQADGQPEPFAREAKYFSELRTLNKEVKVVLEGISQVRGQECRECNAWRAQGKAGPILVEHCRGRVHQFNQALLAAGME